MNGTNQSKADCSSNAEVHINSESVDCGGEEEGSAGAENEEKRKTEVGMEEEVGEGSTSAEDDNYELEAPTNNGRNAESEESLDRDQSPGDVEAQLRDIEEQNMEKPTDRTKLFFEISNFRDHFSRKDFFVALVFGLLPSGWDTFSDFAFASDDHNSTVDQIYEGVSYENENWPLRQETIRTLTYFIVSIPLIVSFFRWFINVDFCNFCFKLIAVAGALVGLPILLTIDMKLESSPIFLSLASVSAAIIIAVKLLAVFVHGPEMKRLSLRASLTESSNESAMQLIFVGLISMCAKKTSVTGLLSMASSLLMVGKAAAETYLTFGNKEELKETSLLKHVTLLATFSPVFILTAVFRIGSFVVITSWLWALGLNVEPVLPGVVLLFLVSLYAIKAEVGATAGGNWLRLASRNLTTCV